jgi:hypothetical protein
LLFASGLSIGVVWQRKEPAAVAQGVPPAACTNESGDVDGSGKIEISDAVYLLNYLFLGSGLKPLSFCQPAMSSALPATGQTKCYDQSGTEIPCDNATCPGQDGFYRRGCAPVRFVDNVDGTVTDTCTGLMWQRDWADVSGDGQSTVEDRLVWCDASAYCENLSFAGHDDWRLPNVRELQSIVDYGRVDPAIDPVFGVLLGTGDPGGYWSSTSSLARGPNPGPASAWYVNYFFGVAVFDEKASGYYVRAVRGP